MSQGRDETKSKFLIEGRGLVHWRWKWMGWWARVWAVLLPWRNFRPRCRGLVRAPKPTGRGYGPWVIRGVVYSLVDRKSGVQTDI